MSEGHLRGGQRAADQGRHPLRRASCLQAGAAQGHGPSQRNRYFQDDSGGAFRAKRLMLFVLWLNDQMNYDEVLSDCEFWLYIFSTIIWYQLKNILEFCV